MQNSKYQKCIKFVYFNGEFNSLQKYLIPGKILDKINKKKRAIPIECKAGSCLFFHSKLIHGSAHNISAKNRIILLYDIASKKNYRSAKKERVQSFNREKRKKFESKELRSRINQFIIILIRIISI